jgi:hypothetical protein
MTTPRLALRQTVLDCPHPRALAEFYRQLLGYTYRPGDEPPPVGEPDPRGHDWLVLLGPDGARRLAFPRVDDLPEPVWPNGSPPQMLHLDLSVANGADLAAEHDRALALGARELLDRTDDPDEPLWVLADPAGHPFCIFVSPDHPGPSA